jgi:hypothetical protein
MSEITSFIESKEQIKDIYEIVTVSHPKIEENYGIISIVKVKLDNSKAEPLVVFPGYSNNSFETGFDKVLSGFDTIKKNYSVMYYFCWGSTLKKLSDTYADHGKDDDEKFKLNDELKIKVAHVADKILRSPEMELKNFSLLAKSAGAGIAIYVTSMNMEIKKLYIACPAITAGMSPLSKRKELPIKLSWNEDDNKIEYAVSKVLIKQMKEQKNKFEFFSYKSGGHEFNTEFIKNEL